MLFLSRLLHPALALALLLVASACDSANPVDADHFEGIQRVEVRDRATDALVATYDRAAGTGFGTGDHVHLHPGGEIALDVLFFDADGRQAALREGGEYTLGIRLATQSRDGVTGAEGVVSYEAHDDHADIAAVAEGETHLVFQLMHGGHSDGDAPALRFEVGAH